jgi:very-short-patch-repair endonuclease
LDSLAYHFPALASQWSTDNPVTAWHIRPSSSTPFVPQWVCSEDSSHRWQSSLSSRSSGAGCPQCREHGKSSVELQHFAAARELFASAVSGAQLRRETFVRRPFWWIDILATTASGVQVAIEYDGAYWHADKGEVDSDKTVDLLGAGYRVARLRERPLRPLPIADKHYLEVAVHSAAPDPARLIGLVAQWVQASL